MTTTLDQLIWPRCLVCFRGDGLTPVAEAPAARLCGICRLDFATLAGGEALAAREIDGRPVVSLAIYRGAVRHLVLRAKVDGDHAALAFLEEWSARRARSLLIARGVGAIVAVPASLWSRWRGRLDVAHAAATILAGNLGVPLVPAPPRLHWRWKKRALSGRRSQRSVRAEGPAPPRFLAQFLQARDRRWRRKWSHLVRDQIVLIVDDVVTTGGTVVSVAQALEDAGAARVRALALASALAS